MAAVAVRRIQPGSAGRPIQVTTNSFLITRRPTVIFYQYDVMIEKITTARTASGAEVTDPTLANPRRNGEILQRMQDAHAQEFSPAFVYDGKKALFIPKDLGGSRSYTVALVPGLNRATYKVILTRVLIIHPSNVDALLRGGWQDYEKTKVVINLLQLILRAEPLAQNHTVTARAVFPHQSKFYIPMKGGIGLRRGFWQSVRPAEQGLVVQNDTSMTAMYAHGSIVDIAQQIAFEHLNHRVDPRILVDIAVNVRYLDLWKKLQSYFKGLRFISRMNPTRVGRVQTIKGLIPNAGGYRFIKGDSGETTVADYHLQLTNRHLQWPQLFGIVTGRDKDVIIPAECVSIVPGQLYRKKMSAEIMNKLLELSKKRPQERFRLITDGQGSEALGYNSSAYMHLTGMQVSGAPLQITGRVLESPKLLWGGTNPRRPGPDVVVPEAGAWNVLHRKFIVPATISNWAVVILDSYLANEQDSKKVKEQDNKTVKEQDNKTVKDFLSELIKCLRRLGVDMCAHNPTLIRHDPNDIWGAMKKARITALNETKGIEPTIYVFILPEIAPDPRRLIKAYGDIGVDCPTQCVNAAKLRKNSRSLNQYANNIALKINVKCGGLNSYVAAHDADFSDWMVIGADVGHASPGSLRPSMAGLVYSVDPFATRYFATSSIQMPRTEVIAELKEMLAEVLFNYIDFHEGKKLPKRLLFYRDGISEGEFDAFIYEEVKAIRAAVQLLKERCMKYKVPDDYNPPLTYVVVGKRHHTRFCPQPQNADASGNCPAGLVVDRAINNPLVFDFYLQSHAGLLGTSRPAHYSLLHDENNFTADALQRYTYALCHVYARATRAVSIPAPVYYADLVCSRSEYHYKPGFDQHSETSTVDSRGQEVFDEARLATWKKNFGRAGPKQSRAFYFM